MFFWRQNGPSNRVIQHLLENASLVSSDFGPVTSVTRAHKIAPVVVVGSHLLRGELRLGFLVSSHLQEVSSGLVLLVCYLGG